MAHIGARDFYKNVIKPYGEEKCLILLEGVKDKKHIIPEKLSYGNLAKKLNLGFGRISFRMNSTPVKANH